MDVSLASSVVFSPLPTFLQSESLFSFSTIVLTAHKISNTWKTKMQLKLLTKAVKTRSGDHKENKRKSFCTLSPNYYVILSVLKYVLLLKITVKFVDKFLWSKPSKQVSKHQVPTSNLLAPAPLSDVCASPQGSSTFPFGCCPYRPSQEFYCYCSNGTYCFISQSLSEITLLLV